VKTPAVIPKQQNSVKRKKKSAESDSSDSSDSEDESKLNSSKQISTQPQKKQKLNNLISNTPQSNLNTSSGIPIASDSTKKRRGSSPFRRIKGENIVVDERLQKSSEKAKHEIPSLASSRGKKFRHEKTKKKRNNSVGKVDMSVKSIQFD